MAVIAGEGVFVGASQLPVEPSGVIFAECETMINMSEPVIITHNNMVTSHRFVLSSFGHMILY